MHAWESIQRVVDHIEINTSEEFTMESLAETACLSPYYFQRLFKRLVKKPVFEYVRLRRLAQAANALKDEKRIADVAVDYGFSSHAHFTKAFKETYGITPEEYRENSVILNNFIKPDLLLNYVMVDEGVPLISDGIVLEINRKFLEQPVNFIGISGYVRNEKQIPLGKVTGIDEPGAIWKRFKDEPPKIESADEGREIGVSYKGDAPEGCFTYFAGTEVKNEIVNEKFIFWKLPAQNYIVCGFEAEDFEYLVTNALDKAMYFCFSWLDKKDLKCGDFVPELYYKNNPNAQTGADGYYMELWFPIKEKKEPDNG